MEDPYIEYLMANDLISSRRTATNSNFERIVKKLISLQTEIEQSKKSLMQLTWKLWPDGSFDQHDQGRRDPDYIVNYRTNIIEMKKTLARHTRSLLKSVQTNNGRSSPERHV